MPLTIACPDTGRAERWALLSRHREQVLRTLRRRFGDFADAEDVVDEAMLRLVDTPDLAQQRVAALLYTTAHNLNIDRHRRGVRHRRAAARLDRERTESPDDLAVVRDQLAAAMECVAGMSEKEQRALAGRVLGYRPAETAEIMGVSTTSVYQALSRARSALRAALGGAAAVIAVLRRAAAPPRLGAAGMSAATVSAALTVAVVQPWASHAHAHVMAAPPVASAPGGSLNSTGTDEDGPRAGGAAGPHFATVPSMRSALPANVHVVSTPALTAQTPAGAASAPAAPAVPDSSALPAAVPTLPQLPTGTLPVGGDGRPVVEVPSLPVTAPLSAVQETLASIS